MCLCFRLGWSALQSVTRIIRAKMSRINFYDFFSSGWTVERDTRHPIRFYGLSVTLWIFRVQKIGQCIAELLKSQHNSPIRFMWQNRSPIFWEMGTELDQILMLTEFVSVFRRVARFWTLSTQKSLYGVENQWQISHFLTIVQVKSSLIINFAVKSHCKETSEMSQLIVPVRPMTKPLIYFDGRRLAFWEIRDRLSMKNSGRMESLRHTSYSQYTFPSRH